MQFGGGKVHCVEIEDLESIEVDFHENSYFDEMKDEIDEYHYFDELGLIFMKWRMKLM